MSRFINYLKDTRDEIKHVSWPTRTQATVYTALVIGISVFAALYMSAFDLVFSRALDWFIK